MIEYAMGQAFNQLDSSESQKAVATSGRRRSRHMQNQPLRSLGDVVRALDALAAQRQSLRAGSRED